jgi:hypothetical protein
MPNGGQSSSRALHELKNVRGKIGFNRSLRPRRTFKSQFDVSRRRADARPRFEFGLIEVLYQRR